MQHITWRTASADATSLFNNKFKNNYQSLKKNIHVWFNNLCGNGINFYSEDSTTSILTQSVFMPNIYRQKQHHQAFSFLSVSNIQRNTIGQWMLFCSTCLWLEMFSVRLLPVSCISHKIMLCYKIYMEKSPFIWKALSRAL